MGKFEKEIKAYALKNVLEFGRAEPSKVLPKLFQHGLVKEEIKDIMPEIIRIVDEVNALDSEERKLLFANYSGIIKEREEKERELPELPNVYGKVVLRIAPFPSGALHLGNMKTFLLNYLYTEKYKGKLLLFIDDTIGSAEKQIQKESYGLIEEAFKLLEIKFDEKIIYKSNRLKIYYKYALDIIKKGKAYVCHCSQEELKKNREEGKECGCRQLPINIQLDRWKEMFKLKEGKATLRIRTDMSHPNPAFRDRVLFKISDRKHPRVGRKYRVWPTLEMSWAIDDHLFYITHIIRGNDLMIESDMEKFIWDIFGWKHPILIHTGLVQIEGAKMSKSKSQEEVKSGRYIGWDDPRTWSIQSLIKRGIKHDAIKEFVKEIGLNKQDITVPIESLYAINRRLIDKEANRYSFVVKPFKLKISGAPNWNEIEVPIHPDKVQMRKIKLGEIYISQDDFYVYRGQEIRLLHLYNVKLWDESSLTSIENKNIQKINWVSEHVKARVLMHNGEWIDGFADFGISELQKGALIQFERFGFCRYNGKKRIDGKWIYEFWFGHK